MPLHWGPSDKELINARSYQFSANSDSLPFVDQSDDISHDGSDESEVEDDGGMNDLLDLAEAAHLVDVYRLTDEDIVPLQEVITYGLHDEGSSSNTSPRKRSHL